MFSLISLVTQTQKSDTNIYNEEIVYSFKIIHSLKLKIFVSVQPQVDSICGV